MPYLPLVFTSQSSIVRGELVMYIPQLSSLVILRILPEYPLIFVDFLKAMPALSPTVMVFPVPITFIVKSETSSL